MLAGAFRYLVGHAERTRVCLDGRRSLSAPLADKLDPAELVDTPAS
jgi:hypothetical protein